MRPRAERAASDGLIWGLQRRLLVMLFLPLGLVGMVSVFFHYQRVRIATRLGVTGQVLHAFVPRIAQIVMNTSFRMFPDSSAAKGEKGAKPQLSPEAVAMQQMMRGIHF